MHERKQLRRAIIWTFVVQVAIICGIEAVLVSLFTGTPQFDGRYRNPSVGTIGLITALYPVFAAVGSLSTLGLSLYSSPRFILQTGSLVWLFGFLLGALCLTLEGILGARAIKGFAIGLLTSMIAPYIESVGDLVEAAPVLTSFQALVPFALMVSSIIATFLHHYDSVLDFNLCWLVSASLALPVVGVALVLPRGGEPRGEKGAPASTLPVAKILKACMVQVGVQLTGVNFVLYYTSGLCAMLGFASMQTRYVSMGLYACNFAGTLASVPLVKRVPLAQSLKYSAAAMSLCHGAMFLCSRVGEYRAGAGVGCIAVCYLFMAVFSLFFNGISFVYTAELVPREYKSLGVGAAIGAGWLANAALSAIVPLAMARVRGYTFLGFNWACAALWVGF